MSRAAAASSALAATRAIAVGTPASAMTSLAKALEASSWAAALLGPKTGMPASRTASDTPAARGASGPTTTRSTPSLVASAATASGSFPSIAWVGTSLLMPALPGAAWTSETLGSASRERTMACSRPPGPMTSTFTVSKGTLCTPQAPKLCRPPDVPGPLPGHARRRPRPVDIAPGCPPVNARAGHVHAPAREWLLPPRRARHRSRTCPLPVSASGHDAHMSSGEAQGGTCSLHPGKLPAPGGEGWTCPLG